MAHPTKDHFSLAEILERWRHASIDEATLLKLAAENHLVFAFYKPDLGDYSETIEVPDGRVTRSHTTAFSFKAAGSERPPLQYLAADDVRRIFEARGTERITIRGHYSSRARTKESGIGYLGNAPQLTRDDLLLSREERDRFEREHKPRLSPKLWDRLADQANQRVLILPAGWITAAIIGLWTLFLYTHPPRTAPEASAPAASTPVRP